MEPVILKLILTKRVGQRVSDDGNEIIIWSLTKKYYKLVFVSLMKSLIVSKLSFYSSDVKESWSQISRTHNYSGLLQKSSFKSQMRVSKKYTIL